MCHKEVMEILEQEVYNVSKALNTKRQKIVATNGDIQPHVLCIRPSTSRVSLGSHYIKKVVADKIDSIE